VTCQDRSAERAEQFAERYGCQVAPTLEALMEHPEVEAVAIFTPNGLHRPPAEAAAAAGKHVFVDKPIANSIEDSVAMIQACDRAGVVLMVGHSSRYAGTARALKSLVDSGKLGQLAMVEANNSHSGGTRLTPNEWRWHRDEAPGGPLMQLAIHSFDTLHCLFGPTRRATALSNSSLLPSEIEDVFLTLLEFESGLLAYVGTNYMSPSTHFIRIYGQGGAAYCEGDTISLATVKEDEPWITATEQVEMADVNPPAAEMQEFARAIRAGDGPETSGREGLLALAVVWACIRSAEQQRPVAVEEIVGDAVDLLPPSPLQS
jgi:predicted dehydrogenase